jgi:hypothetical protein
MGSVQLRATRNGVVAAVVTAAAGFALNALVGSDGSPPAAGAPTPRSATSNAPPMCQPKTERIDRATLHGMMGRFEGIWFDGPDDGWAVGWSGTPETGASALLAHWDGFTWTRSADAPDRSMVDMLLGVDGTDPHDVWAVGWSSNGAGREPLAIHYDGSSWEPSDASHDTALFDVRTLTADDAWAVGSAGDPKIVNERAIALHWDGATWTQAALPVRGGRSGLYAIAGAAGDLWAVGYHHRGPLVLHYDGTAWEQPLEIHAYGPLDAVAVAGDTVWLAGSNVLRGDGSYFADVAKAGLGGRFSALAATAAGAFAVGSVVSDDGTRAIAVELDGDRTTAAHVRAAGDEALEAIALAGGHAWAAGWHQSARGVVPLVATVRGC